MVLESIRVIEIYGIDLSNLYGFVNNNGPEIDPELLNFMESIRVI